MEGTQVRGTRERAEAALRASALEHVIVRAAQLDDTRVDEDLPVVADEDVTTAEELRAGGGEEGAAAPASSCRSCW